MSLLTEQNKFSKKSEFNDTSQADLIRFSDDRPMQYLGYLIILLVFVFFGGWAYWAPLGSAALAPGTLKVKGSHKKVQHLEGGIVKAIHVHNGDIVSKGQILIELEDTSSKAQLQILRGQFFSALAHEVRLMAERDGKKSLNYPASLRNEANDIRAQEAMRIQNQSFFVRQQSRQGQRQILSEQQQQLVAKIDGINSQKHSRNSLAYSLKQELVDMNAMLAKGYVKKTEVSELERRLADAQGDHGEFDANIATTQTQISEITLKALQIDKDFQSEVVEELGKVQAELSDVRERIALFSDTVTRTIIKAPEAGMVMNLNIDTLGAIIAPGSQPGGGEPGEGGGTLLEIVPQQEKLIVDAHVSQVDIDRVHIGQSTEIRFSAFKSAKTPKVEGRLTQLSADVITETRTQQPPYFKATVEVDQAGLDELKKRGLILVPGMPAEVLINTGERTFFEYLAQPLSNIFARSLIED
jgi:membrane fusion protein, epimerase transport system